MLCLRTFILCKIAKVEKIVIITATFTILHKQIETIFNDIILQLWRRVFRQFLKPFF